MGSVRPPSATSLCARTERPDEFRGAWTDCLGKISHAANSTIARQERYVPGNRLELPEGVCPRPAHGGSGQTRHERERRVSPGGGATQPSAPSVWLRPHAAEATRSEYQKRDQASPRKPLLTCLEQGWQPGSGDEGRTRLTVPAAAVTRCSMPWLAPARRPLSLLLRPPSSLIPHPSRTPRKSLAQARPRGRERNSHSRTRA